MALNLRIVSSSTSKLQVVIGGSDPSLNHIDNIKPASARGYDVFADDNYVYIADYNNGLYSYEFNGTTLTQKDLENVTSGIGIWGDGNYLYYCAGGSIYSYSVDGAGNLTQVDSDSTVTGPMNSRADSNFLYVADHNGQAIDTYSVSSGIFTHKTSKAMGISIEDVAVGNGYVFALDTNSGVYSFSVNTTTGVLTQIDTIDEGPSSSLRGHLYFYDNKLYAAMNVGWFIYDVDGAGNLTQSFDASTNKGHSVYVDNTYIYLGGVESNNDATQAIRLFDINDPSTQKLFANSGGGRDNNDEDIWIDANGIYSANFDEGTDAYVLSNVSSGGGSKLILKT